MNKIPSIVLLVLVFTLLMSACQTGEEMVFTEEEAYGSSEEVQEMDFTEEEVDALPENNEESPGDNAPQSDADGDTPKIDLEEEIIPEIEGLVPYSGAWTMSHDAGSYTCNGTTYDFPATDPEAVEVIVGAGGDVVEIISSAQPGNPLVLYRYEQTEYGSAYNGGWIIDGNNFTYELGYFGDGLFFGALKGDLEQGCSMSRGVYLEPAE